MATQSKVVTIVVTFAGLWDSLPYAEMTVTTQANVGSLIRCPGRRHRSVPGRCSSRWGCIRGMRLDYRARMRRRCAWLVVATALMAAACTGPSLDELIESVDSLAVPTSWEFVAEEVAERPCPDPVENCPRVKRTYEVPGATAFGAVISQMLKDAGFDVWIHPAAGAGRIRSRAATPAPVAATCRCGQLFSTSPPAPTR